MKIEDKLGSENAVFKLISIFLYKNQFISFCQQIDDLVELPINYRDLKIMDISKNNLIDMYEDLYLYCINETNFLINEKSRDERIKKNFEILSNKYNLKLMNSSEIENLNLMWIEFLYRTLNIDRNKYNVSFSIETNIFTLKSEEFNFDIDIIAIKNIKKIKLFVITKSFIKIIGKKISLNDFLEIGEVYSSKVYLSLIKEINKYIIEKGLKLKEDEVRFLNKNGIKLIDLKEIRNRTYHFDYFEKPEAAFYSQVIYILLNFQKNDETRQSILIKVIESVSNSQYNI